METSTETLCEGWSWREHGEAGTLLDPAHLSSTSQDGWTVASCVPSEIHLELLKVGRIPDPFKGFNEHDVQCMSLRQPIWHLQR